MIWFEVMPDAIALRIEDFVSFAVIKLGYRVWSWAKRKRMEMSRGDEV